MMALLFGAAQSQASRQNLDVRSGCGTSGAVGDGAVDDSAAIAACITLASSLRASGIPSTVYFPAGRYLINGTLLPLMKYAVAISGAGQHATYLVLGPSYSGAVFSFSDAWMGNSYNGPTLVADNAGPTIRDLSIVGNTTSASEQDGIVFYDHNDMAQIDRVSVFFLNGQCLVAGKTLNDTVAWLRESVVNDFQCWFGGTASKPAVELDNQKTIAADSTNQNRFKNLSIFAAASVGLSVHASMSNSSIGAIEFHSLRVERSGGDNIDIGNTADLGLVTGVSIYGLTSSGPGYLTGGAYALSMGAGAQQGYGFQVVGGALGPCWPTVTCYGLKMDNVRLSKVIVDNIATVGTNVTYTSRVGADVVLDANGLEASFTYSVPGTVTAPAWNTFTP